MSASPICTVADGAGAPQTTENGVDVTPGNTIHVALVSIAGADVWSLAIVGQDDAVTPPTITVNQSAKTATFAAPSPAPWALVMRSSAQTTGDPEIRSTTFKVCALTLAGNRLLASGEYGENDAAHGWAPVVNDAIRGLDLVLSPDSFTIDASSATPSTGKVVSLKASSSNQKLIVVAVPPVQGGTLGVLVEAHSPGDTLVHVAIDGSTLPNSITGLGASTDGAPHDVMLTAAGGLAYVYNPSGAETIMGHSPGDGRLVVAQKTPNTTAISRTYNPQTFGAALDGVTDDANAWDAMIAAIVANGGFGVVEWKGLLYASRDLLIPATVALHVKVRGGGIGVPTNGFRLAPLRKIIIKGARSWVQHFDVDQTTLACSSGANKANYGCLDDGGNSHRQPSTLTPTGYCVVYSGATHGANPFSPANGPDAYFRATTGGTTSSGSEPSGFATASVSTIGTTYTDGGVTWTCEAFPKYWQASTAYQVGQRVLCPGDNRFYYECTANTGDKHSAASIPTSFTAPNIDTGDGTTPTITDNHVTWQAHSAATILVMAGWVHIDHFVIRGGLGFGVQIESGNVDGVHYKIADFSDVENGTFLYTGGGVHIHGADSNGCHTTKLRGIFMSYGSMRESANAQVGVGEHLVWDRAQGSNHHHDHYSQFAQAPAYVRDDAATSVPSGTGFAFGTSGAGAGAKWSGCYSENGGTASYLIDGEALGCDFDPASAAAMVLSKGAVRNVQGYKPFGAKTVYFGLDLAGNANATYPFHTSDDPAGGHAWWYEYTGDAHDHSETGWNAYGFAPSRAQFIFGVSLHGARNTGAGAGPGPNKFRFYQGFFTGDPISTSPYWGTEAMLASSEIRYGHRIVGDRFFYSAAPIAGGWRELVCTVAGYRGTRWSSGIVYAAEADSPYGIEASVVEPSTAPQYLTDGTTRVWKWTGGPGTHAGGEPTWPGSGNFTDGDGNTWVDLGVAAVFRPTGAVDDQATALVPQTDTDWVDNAATGGTTAAKARVRARRRSGQTTANTANQVLLTTPTLTDNATTVVDVLITGKKNGSADVISAKLSGTFFRNAAGAPVNVPTDDNTVKTTAGLNTATFNLAVNGNAIDVRVSPGATVTVDWAVAVQLSEAKS